MVNETPRSRRRAATLARILDAAVELITVEGFTACTLQRVARAADYTPAALYRYFPDKEALIGAVTVRIISDLTEALRAEAGQVPDDAPRAPLARLLAVLAAYRRFAAELPHRFAALTLMMAHPTSLFGSPARAAPAIEAMGQALAVVHGLLDEAVATDAMSPGDAAARGVALFASVQGVLQLHKQARLAPELVPIDRVAAAVGVDLLHSWGASREALSQASATIEEEMS